MSFHCIKEYIQTTTQIIRILKIVNCMYNKIKPQHNRLPNLLHKTLRNEKKNDDRLPDQWKRG